MSKTVLTNGKKSLNGMKRILLLVGLAIAAALPAQAQDFYVITAGSTNYLAHNAALTGGLTNATSFNANTCLWTISGSNIIAIAPDGTQGYYLSYENGGYYGVSLRNDGNYINWSGVSNGGEPNYNNYYLRYRNSAWGVSNNNTHGVLTKITVTDAPNTSGSSTPSYTVTLGGDGVVYSTAGTHTYTADVNQVVTYAQTIRTFSGYAASGSTDTTINKPYPVSSAYTGTLTNVAWSVSDNAYGATITSAGVLTVTSLPADVANLTVTYTAQAGGQPVSGTMTVMLAKDAATYDELINGSATGISGGIVTLNDYEPHEWAYYNKELGSPIRSWNPANVKITYYGNGTNTVSTTDGATPAANSWTANATGVQVSYNETQDTFVYYKTLERVDGLTADNPTGRCKYKTIPNPFSKRPVYNTGDARWRGFYAWRVKSLSGGTIHSAATGGTSYGEGSTINAETEIYFAPTSEYGMTVELEALWARAYVKTGNANTLDANNTLNTNLNGGSYERNFFVITSGNTDNAINRTQNPVTISCRYPDGTTGGSLNSTIQNNFTANAITKFEYVNFNADRFSANGIGLVIGRGCTGTINYVRGIDGDVTSPNYTLRLESGTINYISFLRGYEGEDNGSTLGGTPNIKGVLGCDYDRATNSGITNNLIVNNGVFYGYGVSEGTGITYSDESFVVHVKSGKIGNSFTINGSYTANASQSFYIGIAAQRVRGHRKIYVEGGQLASIAGGIDATQNQNNNSVTIRMTGGHVRGSVYGGAARSAAYGNRNIIVTGGLVTGWLGGGCNGEAYPAGQNSEDTYGGITNGATKVYFGGTAVCGGTGSNVYINGSQGGIVFGAGKGVEGNTTSGRMAQGTTVVVSDECNIERNVYGGGNFGYAQTSTDVFVLGGTVHGSVFGGSNQNNGPVVNVTMKGGTVEGDVYGGSNQSGNISGAVNVKVYGGTVNGGVYGCNNAGGAPQSTVNVDVYGTDAQPASGYAINQVFGGGNQANYSGTPQVTVHCGTDVTTPISIGEVYGGGNQATVTGTNVTIEAGNKIGDVYGGGRQANVGTGGTSVTVTGGTIGRVFGGNNISGTIAGGTADKISVTVDKTGSCPMKIGQVFGGGNQAASQVGSITIGCTGTLVTPLAAGQRYGYDQEGIGAVYGGANNAGITGDITLNIVSGIVDSVFGGNNAGGAINGDITVTIEKTGTCGWYVGYVFGGGNMATYSEKTSGHPAVNVKAGKVTHHVFGGGNGSGAAVTGNPTVTLSGTAEVGGNVFGGGNAAAVTGNTKVLIKD